MAEKSEKATPKKLRDARKKGQVAKSQDFPSAFTFIVSISSVLVFASYFYSKLAGFMHEMFILIRTQPNVREQAGSLFGSAVELIFTTSLPLMGVVAAIGVLVNFLIIGPVFAMQAMKPDIKRLNPVTNIRNLFKVKTFVELFKSVLKITVAFALIYSVVYHSLEELIATAGMPIMGAAMVFAGFLKKVVLRIGIFFIAVGIFDLVFQKRNFAKEMKMEKFEVKQEYKDTEGDPHIKGKRKERAREIAYQEGPGATAQANAVVTNPTHIAVALQYKADEDPAPKILTMGQDLMAEMIIKVAHDHKIPIMRNVDLAHTLYYKGTIDEYVPEETYDAIAEILKWLARLEAEEAGEEEERPEIFRE